MRHTISLIVFICMVMLGSVLFGQQIQVPIEVYHAGKSLVDVRAGNAGGSGTVLDMGYRGPQSEHQHIHIATNWHVVNGGGPYSIEFQGSRKRFPATLMTYDRGADIAFLKVERTKESHALARPCVIRSSSEPTIGEMLFWGGYSYRGPLLLCGKLTEKGWDGDTCLTDGYSVSGMSGGGMFDRQGRWVSPLWGYVGNQEQNCMVEPKLMKRCLVSKYGYTPLQIDRAAAPINFPQTMPYGQEIKNPNQPRLDVGYQQPIGGQPIQYMLPIGGEQIPITQPPIGNQLQVINGSIPYKIWIQFDQQDINLRVLPQIISQLQQQPQIQLPQQQLPQIQLPQQQQPQIQFPQPVMPPPGGTQQPPMGIEAPGCYGGYQ